MYLLPNSWHRPSNVQRVQEILITRTMYHDELLVIIELNGIGLPIAGDDFEFLCKLNSRHLVFYFVFCFCFVKKLNGKILQRNVLNSYFVLIKKPDRVIDRAMVQANLLNILLIMKPHHVDSFRNRMFSMNHSQALRVTVLKWTRKIQRPKYNCECKYPFRKWKKKLDFGNVSYLPNSSLWCAHSKYSNNM